MGMRVRKYDLAVGVAEEVEMPVGANIVKVEADGADIAVLAEIDTAEVNVENRVFSVYELDQDIASFENRSWIGCVSIGDLTPVRYNVYAHV